MSGCSCAATAVVWALQQVGCTCYMHLAHLQRVDARRHEALDVSWERRHDLVISGVTRVRQPAAGAAHGCGLQLLSCCAVPGCGSLLAVEQQTIAGIRSVVRSALSQLLPSCAHALWGSLPLPAAACCCLLLPRCFAHMSLARSSLVDTRASRIVSASLPRPRGRGMGRVLPMNMRCAWSSMQQHAAACRACSGCARFLNARRAAARQPPAPPRPPVPATHGTWLAHAPRALPLPGVPHLTLRRRARATRSGTRAAGARALQ